MDKQEVIEKLKEHGAWCTECHDINGKKDRYVKAAKVRELLEQLDEPQDEKVEVSQEFAEWLETALTGNYNKAWCVKEIAGYGWGSYMHDPATGKDLTAGEQSWVATVQRNKEKHIKAIYDGYTVEQPKRWVVKFEQQNEQLYFIGWTHRHSTQPIGYLRKETDKVIKFPEKEKAEAVALLVDGEVEEV